jgi:hypothetical protein
MFNLLSGRDALPLFGVNTNIRVIIHEERKDFNAYFVIFAKRNTGLLNI